MPATTYNFSPGPAMLPQEVKQQAHEEFLDFMGGISALEISHRHRSYLELYDDVNSNLISLLDIPKNYKVLWSSGGATSHFGLVPLNFLDNTFIDKSLTADYLCTGYWSNMAVRYAEKYINIHKAVDNSESNYCSIKSKEHWNFSDNPLYIYYTPNETISGLRYSKSYDLSNFITELKPDATLIADMTSCILSEPIDVSKYGLIFASAQKNIGPSGVTLIIVREDLLKSNEMLPDTFNYQKLAEKNSLLNTPATYNMYIINLVLKYYLAQGGLSKIKEFNQLKAQKLYDFIDSNNFYSNPIDPEFRSIMNVTFNLADEKYNTEFVKQAEANNLYSLEGHRSIGGFRASIYNAMPLLGVEKLISFMQEFAHQY